MAFQHLRWLSTVHMSWPYHPNPRPSPPVAGRFSLSSRFSLQLPAGTSPDSFTQDGYPSCMCRRVSLTEQRVPLTGQFNETTSRRTITGIIHPALTRLHGVPCCIILRYVKSGFGGPPYLWRLLHPARNGAGQSDSHAPTGCAGCRLPPLVLQYSQAPHPEDLAKPDQPRQLAFAPGCHAFCKQKERAAPALRSLQAGAYSRGAACIMAANRYAGVPARRTFR